jgi:hypothetical protein
VAGTLALSLLGVFVPPELCAIVGKRLTIHLFDCVPGFRLYLSTGLI